MNEKINIAVLVGTTRPDRKSIYAARFVESLGRQREDVNIVFVDPNDFNFPGDGNDDTGKDSSYTKITAEADAFFIVTPEYNHSYPGSLKRMLDSEYQNYYRKAVSMAGVSSGMMGGARALQSLLGPLRKMGMYITNSDVYFQLSYELFDDNGQIIEDKKDFYIKAVNKSYTDLIWLARTLKSGRQTNQDQEG
jgi:NAD(P)H-dependent FMN reductase